MIYRQWYKQVRKRYIKKCVTINLHNQGRADTR